MRSSAVVAARATHCVVSRQALLLRDRRSRFANRKPIDCARRVARAAWGDDVQWSNVVISSNEKEGSELHTVILDVGPDSASAFTRPGQFIQIRTKESGSPAFMAIANTPAPSEAKLELLIKPNESTAGDIVKLSPGDSLQISDVMGKGFGMSAAPPDQVDTLLIFATGTGISPIGSMLDADKEKGGVLNGQYDRVIVFYGARSAESMAYQSKFPEWEAKGATIIPVFSQEKGSKYVQNVFQDMLDSNDLTLDGTKTAIVLCGQKEMAMDIRAIAEKLEIPESRIITNF